MASFVAFCRRFGTRVHFMKKGFSRPIRAHGGHFLRHPGFRVMVYLGTLGINVGSSGTVNAVENR